MTICWPLLILMYYKQSSSMVLTLTFKKDNKQQIYIRAYCLGKRKTKKNVFCVQQLSFFFKVIHILEKRLKVQCTYCTDFIVSSHQQCVCALFLKFTVWLCIHIYHHMFLCAMLLSATAFFILCNLRFIRSQFIGLACFDTCYNSLAFHLFSQNRMLQKPLQ